MRGEDAGETVEALIGLGANLGDKRATLRGAVAGLTAADGVALAAVSPLYETAPVGGPDGQDTFLNAAARLKVALSGPALLALLHQIEAEHLRIRDVRWGPRTLDLDLLAYGETVSDAPALTLPHPRMHLRRFVLAPLADIAAEWRHPTLGATTAELLAALPPEDVDDVARGDADWAADFLAAARA